MPCRTCNDTKRVWIVSTLRSKNARERDCPDCTVETERLREDFAMMIRRLAARLQLRTKGTSHEQVDESLVASALDLLRRNGVDTSPLREHRLDQSAVTALLSYSQADADGVMVNVSRQAIHMVVDELSAANATVASLREALAPFANYACDPACNPMCNNCRARAVIAQVKP